MAEPTVTMKVNSKRLPGMIRCSQTSTANAVEVIVIADSPKIRNRR